MFISSPTFSSPNEKPRYIAKNIGCRFGEKPSSPFVYWLPGKRLTHLSKSPVTDVTGNLPRFGYNNRRFGYFSYDASAHLCIRNK